MGWGMRNRGCYVSEWKGNLLIGVIEFAVTLFAFGLAFGTKWWIGLIAWGAFHVVVCGFWALLNSGEE